MPSRAGRGDGDVGHPRGHPQSPLHARVPARTPTSSPHAHGPPCTPTCAEAEPSSRLVSLGNRAEAKQLCEVLEGPETWPEELCTQRAPRSQPVPQGHEVAAVPRCRLRGWGCEGEAARLRRGGWGGDLGEEMKLWDRPCYLQMMGLAPQGVSQPLLLPGACSGSGQLRAHPEHPVLRRGDSGPSQTTYSPLPKRYWEDASPVRGWWGRKEGGQRFRAELGCPWSSCCPQTP